MPLLPHATEKVWTFLKEQPALGGFVLIGGSALALTIRHRLSEDLDLVFPEIKLPRSRLDAFPRVAQSAGFHFERNDDEATVQAFVQDGLDLLNYQQNFLVDGAVKVSFFTPEDALRAVLSGHSEPNVRVATLSELFKSKCLVSAVRSKTRDWLDLFLLMRDHGFVIADYRAAFQEAGIPNQCETGLTRLCSGIPQRDDEGYAHLLKNAPSLGEMTEFFIKQRKKLEVESAAKAARSTKPKA